MTTKRLHFSPGDRFTRLTVVEELAPKLYPSGGSLRQIRVRCDCGEYRILTPGALVPSSKTPAMSCGCLQRERQHGLTKTSEYNAWANMRDRCNNPNHAAREHYGGRGIQVCDRWNGVDGFANFLADIGKKPTPKHSLDRIDTNGNYEPGNVRWADPFTQLGNRRNVVNLEHNGRSQSLGAWARESGVCYQSLRDRVIRRGWPLARALTEPMDPRGSHPGKRRVDPSATDG